MDKIGITLHVFSGMADPAWEIDENHQHHKAIMSKISDLDGSKPPAAPVDGLGYKGFSVKTKTKTLRIHRQSDKEMEHLLIRTRQPSASVTAGAIAGTETHVVDPVFDHVVESIGKPDLDSPHLPPYEPDLWNIQTVQPKNNCYNYANNKITNTFAQPGRGSGHKLPNPFTGKQVEYNAECDGLKACKSMKDCPGNLVALVIWPGVDFHWYRKDKNDMFSHKPGQAKVRNYDNSGKTISNPEKCDRGPYTEFVSFMATFPDNVIIH